jgi:hypothetical protein
MICDSEQKVIEAVVNARFERIGIEGMPGAGKTTLGRRIAEHLKCPFIELDTYLNKHKGRYIPELRISELKSAMAILQRCVVAGVCLRSAMDKIQYDLDCFIYIRPLTGSKIPDWVERDICSPEDEDARRRGIEIASTSPLIEEVRIYHADYLPYEKADIVYDRRLP